MSSFDFDVPEKDVAGAEHISTVSRQLIAAFVRKSRADKITKAALAEKLGLDKSTVGRMLRGNSNLTLRTNRVFFAKIFRRAIGRMNCVQCMR
jgi:Helix-turn-helix